MEGDLFNIKRRIKTIDNDLDIHLDKKKNKYVVTHKKKFFMNVEIGDLDQRILNHVRKMVYINKHGDVLEEVENNNLKIEKSQEREISNMAESLAKDIRPYVR